MRLLHAADIHIGKTLYGRATVRGGNTRIDDFIATFDRIVDSAIEHRVAAVLVAGDLFDNRRAGPSELAAVATASRRLAEAGITLIVVPGNHDGMSTVGDPSTHALRWLRAVDIPGVYVLLSPGTQRIHTMNDGPLWVSSLPYAHKRAFEDILPGLPESERILAAGAKLEAIIGSIHPGVHVGPAIFVGHLTTVAAATGSEQTMKMSWDVAVGPHVFDGWDYTALGHMHRQQKVAERVWYAGSPEYIDFGEEGQSKGWLLVDIGDATIDNARGILTVTPIPSNARQLQQFDFDDPTADVLPGAITDGAIVKLRFTSATRARPDTLGRLRAAAYSQGASFVTSDWKPPQRVTRARVVISEGTDRAELLGLWLDANGIPREPALTAGRDLIASRM